ncbi:hypothetical protein JQ631_23535 [Bradyrhizobium manausense]|uniref:hypothetical protein n=1 Tax=Bradyrhizobium manausense TaxID=989370 RepID=UPI001BAD6D7A|nr:hypothetical protein [Bradyrhizobium manausense]MBR0792066.1 hypothetical protein [Bradyrhizobium manausense]
MSIVSHGFERSLDWVERRSRTSTARKARLKRITISALTIMTMGSVLTALIALKTVIYAWHLHA